MKKELRFWQGTNFWLSVVLFVGGLFVGFPNGDAQTAVGYLFALVGSVGLIREKVKDAKIDWKAWATSKNTWNYLAAALTAIIPTIPTALFSGLNEALTAAISGNWQGFAIALFSLATIVYHLFQKQPTVQA